MRGIIISTVASIITASSSSFAFSPITLQQQLQQSNNNRGATTFSSSTSLFSSTIISGSPSTQAKSINPKEALNKSNVYTLNGDSISLSNCIDNNGGVSLIVLTRSFG